MNQYRLWAVAAVMLLGLVVQAQETRDIDVTVRLRRDGSALVTQKWDVTVTKGTEWFIPVNGAAPRYIHDLSVVENGIVYESDGRRWDSDRSLKAKTYRCGIVEKRDGAIELCWGQGPYGDHVYEASFIIDNLVQAYDDYDGFNWQFLNDEWAVRPNHAAITIINESGHKAVSSAIAGWGFGFVGDLWFEGDTLRAESTEPFRYESSMIIMMRFAKGIFEPQTSVAGPFSAVMERAFEGSDYGQKKGSGESWWSTLKGMSFGDLVELLIFGMNKVEGWFREAPFGGDLTGTYSLLREGDHLAGKSEFTNLVGAYFLKWIQDGVVRAEKDPKNDKRVNLVFTGNEEGIAKIENTTERKIYTAALEAAGDNRILEANEFKRWSEKHYKQVTVWPDAAKVDGRSGWKGRSQEERCRAVQFRNFLKDFTLVDQREVAEVGLWKDYLVYAQLFGVADKVAGNLKKLFPAQFEEFVRQTYALPNYTSMQYPCCRRP